MFTSDLYEDTAEVKNSLIVDNGPSQDNLYFASITRDNRIRFGCCQPTAGQTVVLSKAVRITNLGLDYYRTPDDFSSI
jgi:hypothetical protein